MRDVERLREKIEVSLDGRQVAALAVSALVLLGAVFTAGLAVGRRSAPPPPQGDLAALDEAHRSQVVPNRPTLPHPPAAEAARPPEPDQPPPVERAAQGRAAPPVHVAQAGLAPAAVVEPPRAVSVAAPRPAVVAPAPQAAAPLPPPPRDVGDYTVQVGASQDRAEALRLEARARGAGLKPYVVEANLGSRGTWYRVRVGAFKDKDSANRFRQDVERELRAPAVVMASH